MSAKSCSVLFGTSPLKEIEMIGNVLILTSLTVGSSASLGRSPLALSTLSLISTIAWSESNPASNSNITFPPPEYAVDLTSFTPSTVFTSSSIGLTSNLSES